MNLNELQETKKTKIVKRALREHYELNIDFDRLNIRQVHSMLNGVKGLIKEGTAKNKDYATHKNAAYLKLVMLEQALQDRLNDLRNSSKTVVVENEEVQKSQVILAAQDMVDSLQKMLEDISKMNVEELTAVAEGVKNEFGTAEGDQFQLAVGQALSSLQDAVRSAKDTVGGALGKLTGDTAMAPELPGTGGLEGDNGVADQVEVGAEMEMPEPEEVPAAPEEEEADTSGAGRERR